MQPLALAAPGDRLTTEPELEQLTPGHHAVLALGQLRDHGIRPAPNAPPNRRLDTHLVSNMQFVAHATRSCRAACDAWARARYV
jgi:hypothetical protein